MKYQLIHHYKEDFGIKGLELLNRKQTSKRSLCFMLAFEL
jgi:hypothetical protein